MKGQKKVSKEGDVTKVYDPSTGKVVKAVSWKDFKDGKVKSISKGQRVVNKGKLYVYNGSGGLDAIPKKPDFKMPKTQSKTNYKSTGSKKGKPK
jgi:hypothetical protein